MKNIAKLFSVLLLLSGCVDNPSEELNESESRLVVINSIPEIGEMHNEMLEIFYMRKNGQGTFNDKVALVDQYFIEHNIVPSLSYILGELPNLRESLELIAEGNAPLSFYADMFSDLHVEGWSTEAELEYQLDLIQILMDNSSIDQTIAGIQNLRDIAIADQLIDEALRLRILDALAIAEASCEYWGSDEKRVPWYARDLMGAIFAVNSGMAGVGGAVAGPAGAGAAILGCAALSSMV